MIDPDSVGSAGRTGVSSGHGTLVTRPLRAKAVLLVMVYSLVFIVFISIVSPTDHPKPPFSLILTKRNKFTSINSYVAKA